MSALKEKKIGFFSYLIVGILSLISLIIYILNVSTAYYEDMNGSIVGTMVIAIALIVLTLILPQLSPSKVTRAVSDLSRVIASALIIYSGIQFLGMRVESFGYIFGSNLELGNEAAYSAGTQAITGIVIFVVTWILSVVAAFMTLKQSKKA